MSAAEKLAGGLLEFQPPKKAEKISDRRTPELVIALVGPVGSGITDMAQILKDKLERDYQYEGVRIIKVSGIIKECSRLVGETPGEGLPEFERINHLQDVGNKLRSAFGGDYLARKCISKIAEDRQESGLDGDNPKPRRKAFIIDSLKHPDEVAVLREIYHEMFWMFGVFSPDEFRVERMRASGVDEQKSRAIMKRDYDEQDKLGQKVSKTFAQADFFVKHDTMNDTKLRHVLDRYLDIIFATAIHTPNFCESSMYKATSIAARSACMSRKVGAAIVDNSGELLAVGWNDVPKYGGGLYTEDDRYLPGDKDCDHRCYNYGATGCRNDDEKKKLLKKIVEHLKEAGVLKQRKTEEDIIKAIDGSGVEALIEFSRAIHAEMEAILAVARKGKAGLVGASIFVTTFPCHSCARHIVASGIGTVYFIEPYPKSKAIDLHPDAISLDEKDAGKKVVFKQYEGVAPKNTYKLFNTIGAEKQNGVIKMPQKSAALPRFAPLIDSFALYEGKVSLEVKRMEDERLAQGV